MAHKLTLPTLSLLALLGAGAGVHLGRSAVAEIDPLYFSERPSRFHADLVPYQSPAPHTAILPSTDAALELQPACYGCAAPAADPAPFYEAPQAAYESRYDAAAEPVETADLEAEPSRAELQRQADLARVERYASYRVSQDEAAGYASAEAEPADQREAPALD